VGAAAALAWDGDSPREGEEVRPSRACFGTVGARVGGTRRRTAGWGGRTPLVLSGHAAPLTPSQLRGASDRLGHLRAPSTECRFSLFLERIDALLRETTLS
jgi:hypothetical protein